MNARGLAVVAALGALALSSPALAARGLGVEVWTDRGDDAVYQPGDALEIKARAAEDAYLLVYEIDAEGYVRLLYPYRGSSGYVEGRQTYRVPPERSNIDLVVQEPVGQCYVVAIAARDRFGELPWYLRPYDMQADQVGFEGPQDDEDGITSEGRIVGDPFVAMERIRRRVVSDSEDPDAFGSSYATYYVHNQVRYPRYLCYDCHRPGRWAWWSEFDPYYSSCSVMDFRINWSWGWGPSYWFGSVPYYYYVVRHDCPPRYRPWYQDHSRFSSWDGWRRWNSMWGNHLIRYKSAPPPGYIPPSRFPDRVGWTDHKPVPPGFVALDRGRDGLRPTMPIGRSYQTRPREKDPQQGTGGVVRRPGRPGDERRPAREVIGDPESGRAGERGSGVRERGGRTLPPNGEPPRYDRPREEKPREQPRYERPRYEPRDETPRYEKPRDTKPADKPRETKPADKPKEERRSDPARPADPPRSGHRTKG